MQCALHPKYGDGKDREQGRFHMAARGWAEGRSRKLKDSGLGVEISIRVV